MIAQSSQFLSGKAQSAGGADSPFEVFPGKFRTPAGAIHAAEFTALDDDGRILVPRELTLLGRQ